MSSTEFIVFLQNSSSEFDISRERVCRETKFESPDFQSPENIILWSPFAFPPEKNPSFNKLTKDKFCPKKSNSRLWISFDLASFKSKKILSSSHNRRLCLCSCYENTICFSQLYQDWDNKRVITYINIY